VAAEQVKRLKAKGRIVEPNILLFKYETREVGRLLGLPPEITERQPFPGPGLGIRYVGRVLKPESHRETCEHASAILREYGFNGVVAPVGNVGIKGSDRAYASVVLMDADKRKYGKIREASNRLGNEIREITRAALILDGEDYPQERWDTIKRMPITRSRLNLLREADAIAMGNLEKYGLYKNISQMPVVLFPGPEKERPWIAIRPVVTPDFMTLRPPKIPGEMSWDYLTSTAKEIRRKLPVGGVVYDTTSKPPGTTEWE
jgi:GMP synthase (glutamine-hydrolysing)